MFKLLGEIFEKLESSKLTFAYEWTHFTVYREARGLVIDWLLEFQPADIKLMAEESKALRDPF